MTTFEDILAESGLTRSVGARVGSSMCSYNPSEDDRAEEDCPDPASWHVRLLSSEVQYGVTVAACDPHLAIVHGRYGDVVIGKHEFGSACNVEGAWWIEPDDETGSCCVTVERGVELGYLAYVEPQPKE